MIDDHDTNSITRRNAKSKGDLIVHAALIEPLFRRDVLFVRITES